MQEWVYAESQLFCSKLKNGALEVNQLLSKDFVMLINELVLGYIRVETFVRKVEILLQRPITNRNRLLLKTYLAWYGVAKKKAFEEFDKRLLPSIQSIFQEIAGLNEPERAKNMLTLWNCENLSYISRPQLLMDRAILEPYK